MNWKDELKKLMKQEYGNNSEPSEAVLTNFIHSLLKEQREICAKKAEAFSRGYGVTTNFIDNQSEIILNAPEPNYSEPLKKEK